MNIFFRAVSAVRATTPDGFAALKVTALGDPRLLERVSNAIIAVRKPNLPSILPSPLPPPPSLPYAQFELFCFSARSYICHHLCSTLEMSENMLSFRYLSCAISTAISETGKAS